MAEAGLVEARAEDARGPGEGESRLEGREKPPESVLKGSLGVVREVGWSLELPLTWSRGAVLTGWSSKDGGPLHFRLSKLGDER